MKIHHATKAKAAKFHITLTVEDNEIVATGKTGARLAAGLQGNKVLEDAITRQTGKPAKGTPEGKAAAKAAPKPIKLRTQEQICETAARAEGWKKTRWGFRNPGDDTQPEAETWQELCEELELIEPHSEEEAELDGDDSDADQSRSIVKAKYKARYKPTKDKSGDELSFRVHDHVSREDDAGDLKIDLDALRTFAKANECWVPSYGSLKSRTGAWNGGMAVMNCNNRLRARLRRIAKEQERLFNIDKDVVWE